MFGGVFEELFSPGRKHTTDEHNRLALARDDDHEDGGPGPIDLDKGIVVIRRTTPAATSAEPPAEAASDGPSDRSAISGGGSAAGLAEEVPDQGTPGTS